MLKLAYRRAMMGDLHVLSDMINDCYRQPAYGRDWTSEAQWLEGDRIQPLQLQQLMFQDQWLLVAEQQQSVVGCCLLQPQQASLGMLTVKRGWQGRGIGRQLVHQAEQLAFQQWELTLLSLWVLSPRADLIQYYQRLGYALTDDYQDYPYGQGVGEAKAEYQIGLTLRRMQKANHRLASAQRA